MDKDEAKRLAEDLLVEFEVDVPVVYRNFKSVFGGAYFKKDGTPAELRLSRKLVEINDKVIVERVIRHEIAHFLVGHRHGHDMTFMAKAREIGGIASKTYDKEDGVKHYPRRYMTTCNACGSINFMDIRDPKNTKYHCGKCTKYKSAKFKKDPKYVLTVFDTKEKKVIKYDW